MNPPNTSENFTALYELHQAAILRYCHWKCRDREVGQNLTQETFLRFWLCLQRQEPILLTRAFLYRIARNLIIDHMRRKKETSLDLLLEAGFEPSVDPWPQTYSQLDAERPLKKIASMETRHKDVLHRRFALGLPPADIAVITGQTSNTVSVHICRALQHLRLELKKPAKKWW